MNNLRVLLLCILLSFICMCPLWFSDVWVGTTYTTSNAIGGEHYFSYYDTDDRGREVIYTLKHKFSQEDCVIHKLTGLYGTVLLKTEGRTNTDRYVEAYLVRFGPTVSDPIQVYEFELKSCMPNNKNLK